jgi:Zn-dependent protease with chaperone function
MRLFLFVFSNVIMQVMTFSFISAQENFLGHSIYFTPKERPNRNVDLKKYESSVFEKYRPLIKNDKYLHEYVSEVLEFKKNYLYSNLEYENVADITAYFEKIANVLKFDSLLNTKIDIKLIRDPSFNAYVYEDGTIYINIGLLANVDSEAEIAAILCHELGHIINQHTYKRFLSQKDYLKAQGVINSSSGLLVHLIASSANKKEYSNDIVNQEKESDALAFDMIRQSNYDYSVFSSIYSKFNQIEEKYKNLNSYRKSWFYFKTHPNSKDRIKTAESFSKGTKQKNKFLVDSAFFYTIKQRAIDECVNLYFEQLNLDECLELSFKQHLLFPTDPFYLFYVTESTRRLIAGNS